MPSFARRGHAAAVFVLLAASFPLPAQQPAWVPKVDALVERHLAAPFAVGFSIGVAKDGEVQLARGFGKAELEFGAAADADTMFRIGSVTKQFTAALILRAAEAGSLSLDDGLERFVPTFPLQGRKVTIRQLLNHSSGIRSYTDMREKWYPMHPLELGHDELLALVAGEPFDFEPGEGWHYNNTGYYLLGMVLEAVHGKPYAAIVHDEIAVPLSLERTRYDSNRELIPNRAQGYGVGDGELRNDGPLGMSQPGAAGGLLSTGGDLVRWSTALAGGKVVSPEHYTLMKTPLVVGGRDTKYGFGLMAGDIDGLPTVTHGGGIHGFNSVLVHVPEHDLHVAVVSNSENVSSQKLAIAIVRTVLDLAEFVADDLTIPAELRDALAGNYRFDAIGMALHVTADGEQLMAKGDAEGQRPFRLMFQGGREFRADFDHTVKLVFDGEGKLELHQGGRVANGVRQ